MTLDEAIKHCEKVAQEKRYEYQECLAVHDMEDAMDCEKCGEEHKQLAEWLKELKSYREFADWLAKAVLEDDWEESADFYAEVLCRKLTKLGKLKVVDNKYMEVNDDDNS